MTTAAPMHQPPITTKVQVIAHRGASALRPEHTLASYAKAIADGADFIEPDLVSTRDGALVARHENAIGDTTDVALHPQFASRRTRKQIDGQTVDDWFCEDFTLAELKTLRARERLPQLRGTAYDGRFDIPALEEIIALAATESAARGRIIGIIPEIKHGSYFARIGLPMEDRLLARLAAHSYTRRAPIEIQSFEIANLRYLRQRIGTAHSNIRLLQLLGDDAEQPWDVVLAGGTLDYAQMMTSPGLREIACYADAIGPSTRSIIPLDADAFGVPTMLVRDAHAMGLEVHPYTFRPENQFMPRGLWLGDDPATVNEAGSIAEIRMYLDAGIDAFFTDAPAIGRKALDER
ncbi:glycerophosphodiester phosphodiesterase [Rhodanobacter sp. L36]|uniref:glycerophosphodiester phosphodiesterase n=1 Tax=Rhodanobacter sp. L36 TaxID=1747221 RepID=UPI00131DDFF3|nr:glycerophosphodiester phosphodiesterase [Rhodanobacter sp. L36]